MSFKEIVKIVFNTSIINTIRFNFHYFDFQTALKIPVFVARHVYIEKLKGKIIIGCPIKTHLVSIGYKNLGTQDTIFDRTILEIDGVIVFHGIASIGRGSKLSIGGHLEIGNNFAITGASTIICKREIQIGDNVLISWDCLFMDTDFHSIYDLHSDKILNEDRPIIIGSNVWVGCRNTVLKGSVIPDESVIAASSLISRKLEDSNCVYGLNTGGKIIKKDIYWER